MYEFYKNHTLKAILMMISGIALMIAVIPVVWFEDLSVLHKFLFTLVWLVPSKILFNAGFIKKISNPYERLYKCYSDSPILKEIYEKEFKEAKSFNNKVWVSKHYLFLREPNEFKVFPLANLSEVNVRITKGGRAIVERLEGKSLNEIYFPERNDNFGKIYLDVTNMETGEILKAINAGILANT